MTCPICGTLNKGLYLEETDGWMECGHCHSVVKEVRYDANHTAAIPLMRAAQPKSPRTKKKKGVGR